MPDLKKITSEKYELMLPVWQKMRDCFDGEETIKTQSLKQNTTNMDGTDILKPIKTFNQYIRPKDSMRRLGALGYQRFCDYIYRAKYFPFPQELQTQSMGLIENQPPVFELPDNMIGLIGDCNANNESMKKVLSKINTEQLITSRVGLLLNPSPEDGKPFNIAIFSAESIVDWKSELDSDSEIRMVWVKIKTDESYKNKSVYLILKLIENTYCQFKTTNEYIQYEDDIPEDNGFIPDSFVVPISFEKSFSEIPFVIINITSLGTEVEKPFLESMADASLSLFRASALYEDALHWGGESTLFAKGYGISQNSNEPISLFVGNGSHNVTNVEWADAKYVTMGTEGIEPRQKNFERLLEHCISMGVDLLNKGTESGTALNIRTNIKTASLKTLSQTGALGLETLLKLGANWLGADSEKIVVKANTTFADIQYTAEDFVKFSTMVGLKTMPVEDLYSLLKKNGLTTFDEFKEWFEKLNTQIPVNENLP